MKSVLLEAVLVAVCGALLAFAANALSPRGLKLNRDYFPGAPLPRAFHQPTSSAGDTNTANAEWSALANRLKEKGLRLIDGTEAAQLFADPRRTQDLVIFIDARDEEHYQRGHIPGAYQFDHYHPENYLSAVVPACQVAQQVVVYCNGGDCEDSEFAAIMLGEAGVAKEKLAVYGGGITEWMKDGRTLERGARNSAQFSRP